MPTPEQPAKIGKYEILSTLGRGGMGIVYKARDPIIDRIVAVKTILVGAAAGDDEGLLDRLHMEARSAGRLQHPNIVTVYDFGEQGDLSYIVMEYVEGVNLGRLIDEKRPLPLDAKLNILIQIGDGLAYAHEHGVVHRDMKPSNVCITARGTAKILDFGLARFDNTRLTKTGYMAGTIAYMSPERLSGETGPKDDIFALGAIAYELLTYQRAFAGTMAPEVISKIISPTPPPKPSQIAGVPEEIDAIVYKALAKDLVQRYETAAEFADDLRAALRSDSMREYLAATQRPTVERSPQELFAGKSSANPYGTSSGKSVTGAPPPTLQNPNAAQNPTLIQSSDAPTTLAADLTPTAAKSGATTEAAAPTRIDAAPLSAAPTRIETTPAYATPTRIEASPSSAAPTQIVSTPPRSRRMALVAVGAVLVVAAVGTFIFIPRKSEPQAKPIPSPPTTTAAPAPKNPLADSSELQLATARNLSEEVGRRSLNPDETVHVTEAKARIALAEKKLNAKDYTSGAQLISDAIAELENVMSTSQKRVENSPVTVTASPAAPHTPKKSQPIHVAEKTETVSLHPAPAPVNPTPVPVPVPQPPQPQPRVEPAPRPVAEPPEKQISTFMRQLATAYQTKDVGFFREHSLRFNDQIASAIRNSPSLRVELQIERIDVRDAQHATVDVKRTDWFPGNAPSATQSLAYNLELGANGWQLASISRR